jgi:hypothetical protein
MVTESLLLRSHQNNGTTPCMCRPGVVTTRYALLSKPLGTQQHCEFAFGFAIITSFFFFG